MLKIPKTFCISPWTQTVLKTSGNLGPCCAFPSPLSIKDLSIKEFFNSEWTKNIKNKMLNGEQIEGCSGCYQHEKKFNSSLRTKTNSLFDLTKFEEIENNTYPMELELQISNICNLKCLTCRPEDSSAFLTEDKIIGISNFPANKFILDANTVEKIFAELSREKINTIDLRGGESMMVPNIKKLLDNISNADEVELKIQTNGTIFDNEWYRIMNKFREVNIMLSIDGFDTDNNYIRFPADWSAILKTISAMQTIKKLRFSINCTVSNINLPILPKFLNWLIEEKIESGFSPVQTPNYFELSILPKAILVDTLAEIKPYQGKFGHEYTNSQFNNIIFYLETIINNKSELDITLWQKFCEIIDIRDTFRKNSIFNIQPKLKEYWHAKNS
jgi:MoaA/NifB/PqqE/SkfB family radical SAM enzyme